MVVNASGRKGHIFPMETTKALAKGTGKVLKGAITSGGKAGKLLLMDLPMGFASAGWAAAQVGGSVAFGLMKGAINEGNKVIEQYNKQSTPQTDNKPSTHKSEYKPPISSASSEKKTSTTSIQQQFRKILVNCARAKKQEVGFQVNSVRKLSKQEGAMRSVRPQKGDTIDTIKSGLEKHGFTQVGTQMEGSNVSVLQTQTKYESENSSSENSSIYIVTDKNTGDISLADKNPLSTF